MAVVTFDFASWAVRYPELSGIGALLAGMYFAEAQQYCDNTDCSPVQDITQRTVFLNMITAHIAAINGGVNGERPSPLVGRITNAAEGSVNVQVQADYPPGTAQWWQTTRYGAAFWAASGQFRRGMYVPGPLYDADPWATLAGLGGL